MRPRRHRPVRLLLALCLVAAACAWAPTSVSACAGASAASLESSAPHVFLLVPATAGAVRSVARQRTPVVDGPASSPADWARAWFVGDTPASAPLGARPSARDGRSTYLRVGVLRI